MNTQFLLQRASFVVIALGIGSALGGCTEPFEAEVTISNRSSTPLTGIFFADTDEEDLGENRLSEPLMPGDDFVIENVDCDSYDLVVTTEDVVCDIRAMDVCGDDRQLVFDDDDLQSCAEVGGEPTPEPRPPEPDPTPEDPY